ncbi:MAG: hypothetical protein ACI8XO_001773 [Verrucomicrobiales bacterium]|jgi:hypothetical protein
MPSQFSQQPYDPDHEPEVRSRFPVSAIAWIPLSLLFAAGIWFAANYGHELATEELDTLQHPASTNETMSSPFTFDPSDEPIVLATVQKALRDHLSAPPGSIGSGTIVESKPLRLRIVERDQDLVNVVVVEGRFEGQRFWTKADRILEAMPKDKR